MMKNHAETPIEVIYEEPHFLLINKPAGLFSQAAESIPSLQHQLRDQIRLRDRHPGTPFIGLPHRLDRATSGIMLIARNARALKRFGQQFQSRKIGKFYLAIVQHVPPPGVHRWQDYIRKVDDQPRAELVGPDDGGRQAVLDCLPVASQDDQTLLVIRLHTGRMHQIRIQAAARGFPIVGDKLYGSRLSFPDNQDPSRASDLQAAFPSSNRLGLHALRLEFHHPKTAKLVSGTAALDQDWLRLSPLLSESAVKLANDSRGQSKQAWSLQELDAHLQSEGDLHGYDTSSIDNPS